MTDFVTNTWYEWFNLHTKKTSKFKYVAGDWSDVNGMLFDFKTLSESGWVLLNED